MSAFSPSGTAKLRFNEAREKPSVDDVAPLEGSDGLEPGYLGWEIARCAPGLDARRRAEALVALAAVCVRGDAGGKHA